MIPLIVGELLPGRFEPVHILDCLPVALPQKIDLHDLPQIVNSLTRFAQNSNFIDSFSKIVNP